MYQKYVSVQLWLEISVCVNDEFSHDYAKMLFANLLIVCSKKGYIVVM